MFIQALITLIYGIIIVAGGVMGFVMAKSMPSLLSGGVLGVVAIIGSILIYLGRPYGKILALVAAILVGLFFGFQLLKNLAADAPVARAAGIFTLSVIEIMILMLLKGSSSGPR
jgi:uncharacterized membrane protein (UPF0136 family)